MDSIAFPIRIGRNGRLRKVNSAEEAIVHLLKIMGTTARQGGWSGMKEFGLREPLAETGLRRGLQPEVVRSINQTLAELGIDWFRVDSVVSEGPSDASERVFSIAISQVGKGSDVLKLKV